MKIPHLLTALLMTTPAFAANFGGATSTSSTTGNAAPPAAATVVSTPPVASGPQVADLFRVMKTDGATLIQQGSMAASSSAATVLNVSEADALAKGNGRCAFNVKYDEVSNTAAAGTTNRLFSNDTPIAINSQIALMPGVVKTIWTQPYLFAGMNNVRVVVNADSAAPSTKWIRINVAGTCGASAPAVSSTTTTTARPTTTTTTTTIAVVFRPGSAEWNNLVNVWGYSNYAVTQLKGKGYARYDDLVKLNTAVTAAVNAKAIDRNGYNSLMTAWNTFITDPVFTSKMAAVAAAGNGK